MVNNLTRFTCVLIVVPDLDVGTTVIKALFTRIVCVCVCVTTLTLCQWKTLGMGLDPFSACAFATPLTQYKT